MAVAPPGAADGAPARPAPEADAAAHTICRAAMLLLLVAAPLAFGAVIEEVRYPFLGLATVSGLLSWVLARRARARGERTHRVPGRRLLLAFNLLVLFQLAPLPPRMLYSLSPSSYRFHASQPGAEYGAWWPITTSPPSTRRAAPFLFALSLFYAAVFREFRDERRSRVLALTLVGVASALTLVGLVQRSSADPTRIYGVWKPPYDWAVFGPYINRSHYAGYVVMAIPLMLGAAAEALHRLRASSHPKRWLMALGEPEANTIALYAALASFNVAGVLVAGARTGVAACGVSVLVLLLATGRRAVGMAALLLGVAFVGLYFADVSWFVRKFNLDAFRAERVVLWLDMLRIVPDFPVFGVGWGALGTIYHGAYHPIHESWGRADQAHNEYLQVLLDTGACGALLALALYALLVGRALRAAAEGGFGAGLLGALAANATTNLADFNLQIPANAAAFAAIAALTVARGSTYRSRRRSWAGAASAPRS